MMKEWFFQNWCLGPGSDFRRDICRLGWLIAWEFILRGNDAAWFWVNVLSVRCSRLDWIAGRLHTASCLAHCRVSRSGVPQSTYYLRCSPPFIQGSESAVLFSFVFRYILQTKTAYLQSGLSFILGLQILFVYFVVSCVQGKIYLYFERNFYLFLAIKIYCLWLLQLKILI